MGKFLEYFRARVLLANMSKKGNDFTVIQGLCLLHLDVHIYTIVYAAEMPHAENIVILAISS